VFGVIRIACKRCLSSCGHTNMASFTPEGSSTLLLESYHAGGEFSSNPNQKTLKNQLIKVFSIT